MKTSAAILWSQPGKWDVTEVDLDEPKAHEVLVRIEATGLCHTDDHFCTGDMPAGHLPLCGGHEGAGVVVATGGAVQAVATGDHVVLSFIPGCGRCRWCASGRQNLCDTGAYLLGGTQLDGTFRMHKDGQDVGQMCLVSTFSRYTVVNEYSCIKVPEDVPFEQACLLGCAVPTGWGSAIKAAQTEPGDVVIVMGTGGIGANAVQGAAHAGAARIIAVDPVPLKREVALKVGATDAFDSMEPASELARSLTNGQGADSVIVTIGVVQTDDLAAGFSAIRKGGVLVVTGIGNFQTFGIPASLMELVMFEKRIQGVCYGSMAPSRDVPRLVDLYRAGKLNLADLVTRTYPLEHINQAYEDLHAGTNVRGVVLPKD